MSTHSWSQSPAVFFCCHVPFSLIQDLIIVLCNLFFSTAFLPVCRSVYCKDVFHFVMKNTFTACPSPFGPSHFSTWASGSSPLMSRTPYSHLLLRQARPLRVSSGTAIFLSLLYHCYCDTSLRFLFVCLQDHCIYWPLIDLDAPLPVHAFLVQLCTMIQ